MLSEIDDFIAVLVANKSRLPNFLSGDPLQTTEPFEAGDIYCPGCGGPRRIRMWPASPARFTSKLTNPHQLVPVGLVVDDRSVDAIAQQLAPAIVTGKCLQDDTLFTFVLFEGPAGYELAVFPNKRGGLATPNTPTDTAYYLDQAQRAESAGAVTAALAMYRSAVEAVMFDQGFTDRMLGPKITALEAAIQAGTAPTWARNLDSDFLRVLKDLGNTAIHVDGGNVQQQDTTIRALLPEVVITCGEILDLIYERTQRAQSRLAALKAAHASLKNR